MLKNTVASVNIIDPAYVESECITCGGRGVVATSADPDDEACESCPTCEGARICECCPCGAPVPMMYVPDAYGVRHCIGEGCDGFVWSGLRGGWIWASVDADDKAEARRLLNGRDPSDDGLDLEEPLEDETTDVTALPDGRPCTVGGCGRVVGDCPHLAPAYVPAARRGAAA